MLINSIKKADVETSAVLVLISLRQMYLNLYIVMYLLSYKKAEVKTPAYNAQKQIKQITNINKTRQNKVNHSRPRLSQKVRRSIHLYTHQLF